MTKLSGSARAEALGSGRKLSKALVFAIAPLRSRDSKQLLEPNSLRIVRIYMVGKKLSMLIMTNYSYISFQNDIQFRNRYFLQRQSYIPKTGFEIDIILQDQTE